MAAVAPANRTCHLGERISDISLESLFQKGVKKGLDL
jgi:hypothetical protein